MVFQRQPGIPFTSSTILHSFITNCVTQIPTASDNLLIESEVVQTGQIDCYNDEQVLTVAGGGEYFDVQNGATARLITGHKIVMLSGTHFQEVPIAVLSLISAECIAAITHPLFLILQNLKLTKRPSFEWERKTQFFKLYPNPTSGGFTLERYEFEDNSIVIIEIYSFGGHILSTELKAETQYVFDLSNQLTGLDLVTIMYGDNVDVVKLI